MYHHIHPYFTAENKEKAVDIYNSVKENFPSLHLGRIHDNPVGPHPAGSFQITIPPEVFEDIKEFLTENGHGLTMLIHPLTGDDIKDHSEQNIDWIGSPVKINRDFFTSNSYKQNKL
jgi:DOPA 4,5-dioxygenase